MTQQEHLHVAAVLHEGFIAVDEQETEAAAATAVEMALGGVGPAPQVRTLRADRPFLYVIHDVATRTPLFVGRVLDPAG